MTSYEMTLLLLICICISISLQQLCYNFCQPNHEKGGTISHDYVIDI